MGRAHLYITLHEVYHWLQFLHPTSLVVLLPGFFRGLKQGTHEAAEIKRSVRHIFHLFGPVVFKGIANDDLVTSQLVSPQRLIDTTDTLLDTTDVRNFLRQLVDEFWRQ